MRTGIMGGTFDPIHHGHLFLAQEVMSEYNLDRVVFVPSKRGPHKLNKQHTLAKLRYEMVKVAIERHAKFEVSDIEIKREGISYTIDTISAFKSICKSDQIYFITGADAIVAIETWKEYKKLLKEVTFIAATRPSLDDTLFCKEIDRLNREYSADIRMMDMLNLEISSSDIRNRVAKGKPITYLVPDCVKKIIKEHGLYDYR